MQPTGLQLGPQPQREFSVGGIMSARPLQQLLEDDRRSATAEAEALNSSTLIQSLAGQIRRHWSLAKEAKRDAETRMLDALRSKRGEYHPDKLAKIRQQSGSEIYMMLFATKARQAKALLGDVLLGTGEAKPYSVRPSPSPDLPPELTAQLLQGAAELVAQAEMMGQPMGIEQIRQLLRDAKDKAEAAIDTEARARAKRAERKMEDMLLEGGFQDAMDAFLDDLMYSPTAFIKGPVIRRKGTLQWTPGQNGTSSPTVTYTNKPCWERVDPLMLYPAPWSRGVNDGYLIEHHRLEPAAVSELIGVPGYKEQAIRRVMDQYGSGGLREWLQIDSERAQIENPSATSPMMGSDLIDALQYWGSVPGKLLREWGMTEQQVPDTAKVYEVEAWLIGEWVIKAEINSDPLAERPYYGDSFERIPGAFWGNSLYDTMRDCEDMCNAAARALANNMGISSGPQAWVMTDRMPEGEDITAMYPWKLWQVTSDPSGSTAAPIGFFQPTSNAQELMAVFERFSILADETTGIPRYMTGDGAAGGAGRTASGMSMMIGNAGKTTKKTVSSIDMHVINPILRSLYIFVMRYIGDPDIKGDLNIEAQGAMSLMVKDSAQVRRAEFLRNTANPIDLQIMGADGRAALLRESAKTLDMNADDVVPPLSVVRMRMAQQQAAQAQMAQEAAAQDAQTSTKPGERRLMNDAPATETFPNQ